MTQDLPRDSLLLNVCLGRATTTSFSWRTSWQRRVSYNACPYLRRACLAFARCSTLAISTRASPQSHETFGTEVIRGTQRKIEGNRFEQLPTYHNLCSLHLLFLHVIVFFYKPFLSSFRGIALCEGNAPRCKHGEIFQRLNVTLIAQVQ